jgi:hypothetical protein
MRLLKFAILIFTGFSLALACNYKNFYIAERNWIMEEPYVLECLSENPREDGARMQKLAAWIKKKYPYIFFVPQTLHVRVDVQERKNRDKAPITRFMSSAHGVTGTLARFEKKFPIRKQFDRLFTSPMKVKIVNALKRKRVILLVLHDEDTETKNDFLKCARKGQKMVRDILDLQCTILTLDINSKREKYLVDNVYLKHKQKVPGIFIMFGKGKGLHFIHDPSYHQVILDVAQMLGNDTNTESASLEARILVNMALPKSF